MLRIHLLLIIFTAGDRRINVCKFWIKPATGTALSRLIKLGTLLFNLQMASNPCKSCVAQSLSFKAYHKDTDYPMNELGETFLSIDYRYLEL
jgi:hypothetical protein